MRSLILSLILVVLPSSQSRGDGPVLWGLNVNEILKSTGAIIHDQKVVTGFRIERGVKWEAQDSERLTRATKTIAKSFMRARESEEVVDRRKDRDKLEYLSTKLELIIIQQKLGDPTRFVGKSAADAVLKDQKKRTEDALGIAKELEQRFAKNQDLDAARKSLDSASEHMKRLTAAVSKKDKAQSAAQQRETIKHLEAAHKAVAEIFTSYRLHEQKRLLDGLQKTAETMFTRQTAIRKAASALGKSIDGAKKKATPAQVKEAKQLAASQKRTLTEAADTLELLKEEKIRGAVPEVFRQLREDAKALEDRFQAIDLGKITQVISQDMVDTLSDLVAALKQARKDLEPTKKQ